MNIIHLDKVNSTNSYLASIANDSPHATIVSAHQQTAGRGQRGNSWEAQPGKNLTFSILLRPKGMSPREQFFISEAVALGIVDAIRHYLPEKHISIKWPNDIYVDDSKICGILIENSIVGTKLSHSIAGIGINFNQEQFFSDAPNPISVKQLSHHDTDLDDALTRVCQCILNRMDSIEKNKDSIHSEYFASLWGRQGRLYRDATTGDTFSATIEDVAPTGHITLRDSNGISRTYSFKEVSIILDKTTQS